MEWLLEIALLGLLAATLFHAVRLERALGVLKRDRAVLEELVAGFNASTRQAEAGVEQLRAAADGAGRHIARQTEAATRLKDDLVFLTERGEALADRLERAIRDGRVTQDRAAHDRAAPERARFDRLAAPESDAPRLRSQAERDLMKALRLAR